MMKNDKTQKPALSKTAVSGSVTASELRIGNLLTDEFYDSFKTIIEVDSIDKKGINLEIMDDGNYPECASIWISPYYFFDYLRPIPITEEWLIKFGFTKCDNQYWFEKDILSVSCSNSYSIIGNSTKEITLGGLKYIHQLQNLYFSLTLKELKLQ